MAAADRVTIARLEKELGDAHDVASRAMDEAAAAIRAANEAERRADERIAAAAHDGERSASLSPEPVEIGPDAAFAAASATNPSPAVMLSAMASNPGSLANMVAVASTTDRACPTSPYARAGLGSPMASRSPLLRSPGGRFGMFVHSPDLGVLSPQRLFASSEAAGEGGLGKANPAACDDGSKENEAGVVNEASLAVEAAAAATANRKRVGEHDGGEEKHATSSPLSTATMR